MPKERKDRSVSNDKYRASPLRCVSSHASLQSSPCSTDKDIKEWEETRCPVCMEHPHNCILLICSSYENGCRPYMCDTSYRHSNCFDQFRKASKEAETAEGTLSSAAVSPREGVASESTVRYHWEEERYVVTNRVSNEDREKAEPKLTCPLCRGDVKKWVVVQPARYFMNSKPRSCSCETCDYSGTYSDLRKHARIEHPKARPSQADPERQLNWRRLEERRDSGDVVSSMDQSRVVAEGGGGGVTSRPEIGDRRTSGGRRRYTPSRGDGRNCSRGLRQQQVDRIFYDDEHEED